MKKLILILFVCFSVSAFAQNNATIREYNKTFTTYPFSDPNPIPTTTNIYPYFRYDGFTDKPVQESWKIVELENDYIKLLITPEIGGKIWAAIEKSTGRPFIYYNHTMKFRDIAMRGPWTSGGIEPNYGIIGHTPNSVTPVDYLTRTNADGSVSCIISVFDLLTRTTWTMEINLPKDKAYFTTKSFWYNGNPTEEPYYHWMNTGIKAGGGLHYMFPGTNYLGHEGEHGDWPINKQNGKDVSYYDNNNFGGYKSYHVFGKYTDFFGAYWDKDDFGMARYAEHQDKAGKKIWIWGLSQQGMIWEKLLTDTDGQYSEIQSGRLFNQTADKSTFTPFKHKGFPPASTDTWTEYWYPVLKTKGFVEANPYGALNLKYENGWLKIYFNPVQNISDSLMVKQGEKNVYSKQINLSPLKLFVDSIKTDTAGGLIVKLGDDKLVYNTRPDAYNISRPLDGPKDFDWNSAYGLYIQGKENMDEKNYPAADEKLKAALAKDPYFLPALSQMAALQYRNMLYPEALATAKKALSINTYDPAANYYYGVINQHLGNITDAKDGFDIASLSVEYRSAAYNGSSNIYLHEKDWRKAIEFAGKAIDFNRFDIGALQNQAIAYRYQNNREKAQQVLDTIFAYEPLSHFALFEKYLWSKTDKNKTNFTSLIRNEQPIESYLELSATYYNKGCYAESENVLRLSPSSALVNYWLAWLQYKTGKSFSAQLEKANNSSPAFVFPFRSEDEQVLLWAMKQSNNWQPKYYLALLYRSRNRLDESKKLFAACGDQPSFAPFYAARASLLTGGAALTDLKKAAGLDKKDWRYCKLLTEYYVANSLYADALKTIEPFYKNHPENYIMGMLYAKALLLNKQYTECSGLLAKIDILPFEGATVGRELYREALLMQAIAKLKSKNYKSTLLLIDSAKQWPQNLGVGKPYQYNIDERLEDWMDYLCYERTGQKEKAQASLQKIINFKPLIENTVSNFLPANHLVSAWAIEKLDGRDAATKWLDAQIELYPGNKILQWCKQVYEEQNASNADTGDAEVRILTSLMAVK